jgi:hypothetical protein
MEAKIITEGLSGFHNSNLDAAAQRMKKSGMYKDLSTVIVTPCIGDIPPAIVQSFASLIRPMNQKVIGPIFIENMEVGAAYTAAVEMILGNPELSTFKYMLTIETDNMPPPDGLMKLYESIEGEVDGQKYDVSSGLYWTKGEMGAPMIYGDPYVLPLNFIPQPPIPESVQRCNGLGMGFGLFRLDMFRDARIPKPWFETRNHFVQGQGTEVFTQDLWFFSNAGKLGYKFCSDNRVKVGHRDRNDGRIY